MRSGIIIRKMSTSPSINHSVELKTDVLTVNDSSKVVLDKVRDVNYIINMCKIFLNVEFTDLIV